MSKQKKHQIVVTRDKKGLVATWPYSANQQLHVSSGGWAYKGSTRRIYWRHGYIAECFKREFGFLPRKGTKEVITIIRGEK